MESRIIQKTLRVPLIDGKPGDGTVVARQFDAALMSVGFKASRELLEHIGGLCPGAAIDAAVRVLGAVRERVGDHVQHNAYFRDFPAGVPDTVEFWVSCILDALACEQQAALVGAQASAGVVNLLDLPRYGRYQHTYEEMLAAHDDLIPSAKDRITVLRLGDALDAEAHQLYRQLAESTVPLNDEDRDLLGVLAVWCVDMTQPETIPVRENRAHINRVRLAHGKTLLVDTVTDVLRLCCAVSGGDETLATPTRFGSLRRPDRRAVMATLNDLVQHAPGKLGDVNRHREMWQRLGERVKPHEYPKYPFAQDVFAVARGERKFESLAGRAEKAMAHGLVDVATEVLSEAPGLLFRSLDWLARAARDADDSVAVADAVKSTAGRVSGRVLLSVREHLLNRVSTDSARVFVNRAGRAWVTGDDRAPLAEETALRLLNAIDSEVSRRLPTQDYLVVDEAVLGVALPLSEKTTAAGFGVMPRGSVSPVPGRHLRFFTYWKQALQRTDYDLSALLLDENYQNVGWLSYTNLSGFGGAHSGDITSAPDGASEFIDIDLGRVDAVFIVPQVNIYSGEGFHEVEESFFGFMELEAGQRGKPFEARTVRTKSELRGTGRVALPLVFEHGKDGTWRAKWMHLVLSGHPNFNQVEGNRLSTALLARSIVERNYLTVEDIVVALMAKGAPAVNYHPDVRYDKPVTFIGLERPEGLPDGSTVYTLDRLRDLIPA